jgi:hypothetical protein
LTPTAALAVRPTFLDNPVAANLVVTRAGALTSPAPGPNALASPEVPPAREPVDAPLPGGSQSESQHSTEDAIWLLDLPTEATAMPAPVASFVPARATLPDTPQSLPHAAGSSAPADVIFSGLARLDSPTADPSPCPLVSSPSLAASPHLLPLVIALGLLHAERRRHETMPRPLVAG